MTSFPDGPQKMQPKPNSYVQVLQISGLEFFEGNDWKGAIGYFLMGVAKQDIKVLCKSKINFGEVQLYRNDDHYTALTFEGQVNSHPPKIAKDEILESTNGVAEVDRNLLLFIHDDTLKMLVIHFGNAKRLYLWKEDCGELHVRTFGLESLSDYFNRGVEQSVRNTLYTQE